MASAPEDKVARPLKFAGFSGVNNKGDYIGTEALSEGVNIDIDSRNRVRRRKGFDRVLTGSGVDNLWSDDDRCVFVSGGELHELHADYTSTNTHHAIHGNAVFDSVNHNVYGTDGVSSFIVDTEGLVRPWGLDIPETPVVAAVAGTLDAGRYGVSITQVAPDGRESGATTPVYVDIIGGIEVTNIVQPIEGHIRVYATSVNGGELYRVDDLVANETSVIITSIPSSGDFMDSFGLYPAPVGHLVAYYKGRMYIAQDNIVWYSEAYDYERFALDSNFIVLPSRITALQPVEDGIFISDTKTYFVAGKEPEHFALREVAPYSVIEGTAQSIDGKYIDSIGAAAVFATERGVCTGAQGGVFKNLTEDTLAWNPGSNGISLVRRTDGMVHFVAMMGGTNTTTVNTYTPDTGILQKR